MMRESSRQGEDISVVFPRNVCVAAKDIWKSGSLTEIVLDMGKRR
jgi:hypothetical protein